MPIWNIGRKIKSLEIPYEKLPKYRNSNWLKPNVTSDLTETGIVNKIKGKNTWVNQRG